MTQSTMKQRFIKCLTAFVSSVFLFGANHLMAASSITVCIEKEPCFPAETIGFSVQHESPDELAAGGSKTIDGGKAIFSDVSVLKPIDSNSAKLFLWAAQGTHLHDATITIHLGKSQSAMVVLDKVVISNFEINASEEENKTYGEKISFSYEKITITTDTDSTCWDLIKNTKC